jgi:hypothetical protein
MYNLLQPVLADLATYLTEGTSLGFLAPVYVQTLGNDQGNTYHALDGNNELSPIELQDGLRLMLLLMGPATAERGVQLSSCTKSYDVIQLVRAIIIGTPFRPSLSNAFYRQMPKRTLPYVRYSAELRRVQLDPYRGWGETLAINEVPPQAGAVWADYDVRLTIDTQCLLTACP